MSPPALNARTAENLLAGTEYDLVLLDINLPDGSGYNLCGLIKPEHPDTVVISLTANGQERDQLRGYEAGAVDYIPEAERCTHTALLISGKRRFAQTVAFLHPVGKIQEIPEGKLRKNKNNLAIISKISIVLFSLLWRQPQKANYTIPALPY